MEVKDAGGRVLTVGMTVRYTGTGTTGEISAIKVEDDKGWARLEDSDLWYSTDYLEVVDKSELKKRAGKRRGPEETLEKVRKMKEDLEDIDMGSEVCDGGG
ncbi:DUF2098 domain-containing protein [Methanothermobacter wolfeii]|uniref:DUF2098 domain-containing protein n=1 Tax=Methanothermobacter wolfeii TaxID=145261 RepID=A0A9E7UMM8_METWO|nr:MULTISPECIES: DUF2098 domain-containing protein [Methanothermobacter]MDI6702237.1 DUF2098 domain-containing protein [Methanothermobacter wolfeii]MDI6842104.1 DUF2098 domain-containing protein [Methanothermobacter wolfeii]NLM02318.1 DUF2098 family protein [Methanothermobacter wolfeii]QHN06576.1 DUF2098 domain-containing protein [Methanothermobacter sp. THM-1]UXH31117.1 DUF2098 domain-containing protein [Methanothermobacter wolfeii]